jgi:MerR family mercuric resistance operon transcriptional regulator
MENLTIGRLAKMAQVNIETVRYYERRGLIPKPPRRESGYRQYPQGTVVRIQFIKHAKELGFSLKEILELLSLQVDTDTCTDVKRRAVSKLADIQEKIKTLQTMKRALTKLAASCSGKGPISECPILGALENIDGLFDNKGGFNIIMSSLQLKKQSQDRLGTGSAC